MKDKMKDKKKMKPMSYNKGGMVKANCGASVPPANKGKKK